MFEHALAVEYGRTNRVWTTMWGFAGEALLIGAAVVAPLAGPQALPRPQSLVTLFYPSAPAAPPQPAAQSVALAPVVARAPLQMRAGQLVAPSRMPARPAILEEPPLTAAEMGGDRGGGVEGGVPGGVRGGMRHGLPEAVAALVPAPPPARPAPPPAAATPAPLRIVQGGNVQHARLVHQMIPVYPAVARAMRVSGVVELVGIVGVDGRVKQLQVVSGNPLLVQAALDAVRQWIYRPTYLNGDPVEVTAPITVSFVLKP